MTAVLYDVVGLGNAIVDVLLNGTVADNIAFGAPDGKSIEHKTVQHGQQDRHEFDHGSDMGRAWRFSSLAKTLAGVVVHFVMCWGVQDPLEENLIIVAAQILVHHLDNGNADTGVRGMGD